MFLQRIKLENILSFRETSLDLLPLNVFIGANASGKSNLIRAIHLLRMLPKSAATAIAEGGGIREWVSKRTRGIARIAIWSQTDPNRFESYARAAGQEIQVPDPDYDIYFRAIGQGYEIPHESLSGAFTRGGSRITLVRGLTDPPPPIPPDASLLSIFRSPIEQRIWDFAAQLDAIRLYREFQTGPGTSARHGVSASAFSEYLSEDGSNLARVLNRMLFHGASQTINGYVQRFFDAFSEILVYPEGAILQTFVREKGLSPKDSISAIGLSDGTLRLLCLLVVLLNAEPPPLVCIEEPEAGLHPDAVRMVAELLIDASQRTQLIVTTHSPALIDALSAQPHSIVVCERDFDGFTQFRRLKSSDLDEWLERYSLGELWQKGEIGGNRW